MSKPQSKPKIETKLIKHEYSPDEKSLIGGDLARAIAELRNVQTEFDNVKASFKAKITEKESRIDSLSTNLCNGFDMRNERCVVIFRPKDREKDFYLERDVTDRDGKPTDTLPSKPALTEPMTRDDFQQDLIQAESAFEKRQEIDIFARTERDFGVIVVGLLAGKWYAALRITVGKHTLDERLDSEQKAFKFRADAIKKTGKRALDWMKENLKESAKGFEDSVANAVASQIEKVE